MGEGRDCKCETGRCFKRSTEGWSVCPVGTFMNKLYRVGSEYYADTTADLVRAECCKPREEPDTYGECVDENIVGKFDGYGSVKCPTSYFMTGMHQTGAGDLSSIDQLRCCQLSPTGCT